MGTYEDYTGCEMEQNYTADEDDNPFVQIKNEQLEFLLCVEVTVRSQENEHLQEPPDDVDDNQPAQRLIPENDGMVTPPELTGEEAFAYCYCEGCILAAQRGWMKKIELVDLRDEDDHHIPTHNYDNSEETNRDCDDEDHHTGNEDQNHDPRAPSETDHFDRNDESALSDDFDGGNLSSNVFGSGSTCETPTKNPFGKGSINFVVPLTKRLQMEEQAAKRFEEQHSVASIAATNDNPEFEPTSTDEPEFFHSRVVRWECTVQWDQFGDAELFF